MMWLVGVLFGLIGYLLWVTCSLLGKLSAATRHPAQSNKYANLTEEQVLALQGSCERVLHNEFYKQEQRDEAVAELSILNARVAELKREREDAEMVARYLPEIDS